jgi:hypothetical protein
MSGRCAAGLLPRGLCAATACAGLLATGAAGAGELRLVNGALIPGELARVESRHIVWKADLVGEITVDKSAVRSLDSSTRLALQPAPATPAARDCRLRVAGDAADLDCPDAAPRSVSLALLRPAPPLRSDTGRLGVALDLERGDDAAQDQIDADLRVTRLRGKRRHGLEATIDYERSAGETTEDEAELLYQGDYLLQGGWYLYGLTEYRRDREASIQESLQIGIGAGYAIEPRDDLRLRVQAGISEVDFDLEDGTDRVTEAGTVRWSGSWSAPWLRAELSHEGKFGAVLEDVDINLLETKTGVSVPISGGLRGELRLDYDRYGISVDGGPREEIEWVLGLGYRW